MTPTGRVAWPLVKRSILRSTPQVSYVLYLVADDDDGEIVRVHVQPHQQLFSPHGHLAPQATTPTEPHSKAHPRVTTSERVLR